MSIKESFLYELLLYKARLDFMSQNEWYCDMQFTEDIRAMGGCHIAV